MVLWLGRNSKARLVPDGEFEKRRCPECGKTSVFREAVVKNEYSAWVVLKLWESESTKYVCDQCGSVMDLDDTEEPELSVRDKKRKAELEAEKAELAAQRRQLRAAEREAAEQQRERDVDDEIASMKKKLGLE